MAAMLALASITYAADVAPDSQGMNMTAHEWCRNVVMGWNLGNALESAGARWDDESGTWKDIYISDYNEWETGWNNPKTTKAMIQAVKKEGFNAVRVPVRWVPHITNYVDMTIDPVWMARVKEVIDWCLEEDLMVVVNTHHELWLESHPFYKEQETLNRKLRALWKNIATSFRDYDERLVFSGTNEVTYHWNAPTKENLDVQNSFNQAFVDAVRETGGKNYYRNLVVQTFACDPSYGLSGFVVPTDKVENRLSVEFHYYSPYSYCSGTEGSYYYWGKAYQDKGTITPDGDEKALQTLFTQIRKKWWEQGLGVVLGEYGVAHHYTVADKNVQEENEGYYLQCVVTEARKNGFAAFVWDNNAFGNGSEYFGIFDRRTGMTVRTPWFLNGIKEGAKTEYSEENNDPEQIDWGAGGTVFWEGNSRLNWGNGLQLKIPATAFSDYQDQVLVVIYYDQDGTTSYEDIQFCDGNWKGLSFSVEESEKTGDFSPRDYYGYSSDNRITPILFKEDAFKSIRKGGLIIQGYGIILKKIVFTDSPTTSITSPFYNKASVRLYNLYGNTVANPIEGRIYIKNGQKILWK